MAHYDTFRDQLAIAYPGFGSALWEPDPGEDSPPVRVGDVGYILNGKFHRLFNALLPANHRSHKRYGVPEDHEELQPRMRDHIDSGTLASNHLHSYGVTVASGGLEATSTGSIGSAKFSLSCKKECGAVLVLPVTTRREDTRSRDLFRKWITKHIDSWFAFSQHLELGIEMEDIVLVSGCHRTRSWSNIAFKDVQGAVQLSLGVQVTSALGVSVNWEVSDRQIQGAVLNHRPNGEDLPEDQCIFIRGFRVKRILPIMSWIRIKAAAGPGPGTDRNDPEPEKEVVPIPNETENRDPLRVLLEYIAQVAPRCDMAVVHDDDLERILGVGDTRSSQETFQPLAHAMIDYLKRLKPEIEIMFDSFPTNNPSLGTNMRHMTVAKISGQLKSLDSLTPIPLFSHYPVHSDQPNSRTHSPARANNAMANYSTLPLEAHENVSLFLEHATNIGRAYRNQALELISICQLLSRIASPKCTHEYADLRRSFRLCDFALRSAADSGTTMSEEANTRFREATQVLSTLSERGHHLDLPLAVYSRMEIAKQKDSVESVRSDVVKRHGVTPLHPNSKEERGGTMTINFVLLRSSILASRDPDTVIMSQVFSTSPSLPEILWNFSRYEDRARITLEQNPHFYLGFPADESAYTPTFQCHPLQGASGVLEHNNTVYVLLDGPGRVFLHAEHKLRIFCNVWSLNGILIFRDRQGVLQGEQLVGGSSVRSNLWYCEEQIALDDPESRPLLNHRCLLPIVTSPSADRPTGRVLDDWTALIRLASRSVNVHIYGSRGPPGSINILDVVPPVPTSERPGYPVHYTNINTLNDDILFVVFSYYRLESAWNVHLGWRKLSHVCRRWRYLVHDLASHLGIYILCTDGTPIVDTLNHLPSLPIFIDYRDTTICQQDELAIPRALRLCDRVRRIDFHLPPSILHNILMHMGESFSTLEHLSLSSESTGNTSLVLPKTCLAPNLRHLALDGIHLPNRLRFLFSTTDLATLVLTNIRASGYFRPRLLVARLESLPQLEELSVGFSIPIPLPSAEKELLGELGTPVTLPNLKRLRFKGVSAYLERIVAQIRTPLLERLDITLFNQIAFELPHLLDFTHRTEVLKLPVVEVKFAHDAVSIIMGHHDARQGNGRFALDVICRQLDRHIDCAEQICSALMPALSGVEKLKLTFYRGVMPTEWQNGKAKGTTWHELLRTFTGVSELHLCAALSEELSRALQIDFVGSDPGLLPSLQELVSECERSHAHKLFKPFTDARRISGRPVTLMGPKTQYESILGDIIKQVERFRILVIGRSGVGKSSLINRIFGIDSARVEDQKVKETDIEQEFLSPQNRYFVLHDSKGFEPGDLSNFEIVRKFIEGRSKRDLLKERIHVLWLCTETPTAGGPVFETGDEKLLQFAHENNVPLVLVFTQYDRLVRTKEFQLRGSDLDPYTLRHRSVEEAQEEFKGTLQSLQVTMDRLKIPMPTYVRVSVRPGHREDIAYLVSRTRDVAEEQVRGDAWVLWTMAQRASLPDKIEACVLKGISYHVQALAGKVIGAGEWTIGACFQKVHKDIIACWSFEGAEVLNSPKFQELMLHLVGDVIIAPSAPSVDEVNQMATPATSSTSVAPALPAFSLGLAAPVRWLQRTLGENFSETQRLLMAYIVDLIKVLIELFSITIRVELALTATWSSLQEAFDAYEQSSSRQSIHDSIRSKKLMLTTGEIRREIRRLLEVG